MSCRALIIIIIMLSLLLTHAILENSYFLQKSRLIAGWAVKKTWGAAKKKERCLRCQYCQEEEEEEEGS